MINKFYNPFKPHIVVDDEGKYYVRRLDINAIINAISTLSKSSIWRFYEPNSIEPTECKTIGNRNIYIFQNSNLAFDSTATIINSLTERPYAHAKELSLHKTNDLGQDYITLKQITSNKKKGYWIDVNNLLLDPNDFCFTKNKPVWEKKLYAYDDLMDAQRILNVIKSLNRSQPKPKSEKRKFKKI